MEKVSAGQAAQLEQIVMLRVMGGGDGAAVQDGSSWVLHYSVACPRAITALEGGKVTTVRTTSEGPRAVIRRARFSLLARKL